MKKEVNLYVFPASPDTDKIKKYLTSRGIAFKVYDVHADQKAHKRMVEASSGACGAAPVIEIGDRIVCGEDKEQIEDTITKELE
ncbi:MAG: glutaredoxin domain-containing protein [Syntrophobacteraceae bacterium]|nr:glutaredoxin domain-containing protein [Syntrophobacteraceae bacterium]